MKAKERQDAHALADANAELGMLRKKIAALESSNVLPEGEFKDGAKGNEAERARKKIKLLTENATTAELAFKEQVKKIREKAKASVEAASAAAKVAAAKVASITKLFNEAEAKVDSITDLFEEQQEETKVMQIFSGRQTDAIQRLKSLALQARVDPQLVASAADLRA